MTLKSDPQSLTLMGFKKDLKSFKIKTSQEKTQFKISNNNLILDGDDTYDQLSITSNNQDYLNPH